MVISLAFQRGEVLFGGSLKRFRGQMGEKRGRRARTLRAGV